MSTNIETRVAPMGTVRKFVSEQFLTEYKASTLDNAYATKSHTHDYAPTNHTHSNYASTSHTHNYAGSSSAGGAATSALKWSNARTVTLSGAVTGSASMDGSANATISTTLSNLTSNKVTAMTGYSKPSSSSAITASDSLNTAIGKLEKGLEAATSGGGSVAWNSITGKPSTFPPTIGTSSTTAAAGNHTHDYAPTNHTHSNYASTSHTHDYAPTNHTHSYLPLSGGQVRGTITTESLDAETVYGGMMVCSGDFSTNGTIRSNILTTGNTQMITADTNTVWVANPQSKVVIESSENPKVRVGSNHYTMYHTGNKPSASDIGAAASSHTHNYAGSSSAGGAANSATKLATARKINGVSFDGTANITVKDDTKLPLTGGTLSGGLCVNKDSKEVWFDLGTNDAYIWNSASNKSLQLKFNGSLDYDDQPIIYGGRGNNYDTAVGTLYFNNSGVNRKGRISCYASENGAGEYVQLAIRDSSSTKNYITIYDDIVRVGSNCISLGGKKLTIATSAPSSPSTGDVWIDI